MKEARIGLEVFGRRAESYDPAIDPIVRVQMGRLRGKLRAYYAAGEGASDRLRIDIPIGSYVPVFATLAVAPAAEPSATVAAAPPDDLRIAVLPIVNMSADVENQYFCDGLTEELINRLAEIRRMKVVARTSSFQFKDAARDIREVGRLLDVSKVLEGSVRKSGNRIRVTVQLINVADGCHLWSERYEGELTDIFAIHEEIAIAVQRALQTQMIDGERPSPSRPRRHQLEAYNHYLQGRFLWKKRTEQGLRARTRASKRRCDSIRPFARALSGIADCHLMLGMSAAESPERSMPSRRRGERRFASMPRWPKRARHCSREELLRVGFWRRDRVTGARFRSIQLRHRVSLERGLAPGRDRSPDAAIEASSKRSSSTHSRHPSSRIWGWCMRSATTSRPRDVLPARHGARPSLSSSVLVSRAEPRLGRTFSGSRRCAQTRTGAVSGPGVSIAAPGRSGVCIRALGQVAGGSRRSTRARRHAAGCLHADRYLARGAQPGTEICARADLP